MGWEIHQMDVKTTFLNGVIEEEVYIEQQEGFETHEKKSHVCRLKKALYGLNRHLEHGSSRLIKDYKKNLAIEFDMKDLGQMHYFLGLEVWQPKGEIFLGQGRYAIEILKRFKMQDYKPMATLVITNWKKIGASKEKMLIPPCIDWVGSSVDRKSTTGYCFNIGSGMTSWCSRKQKSMALSSVEAEYMAASTASCEAIWLRKFLVNLFRRRMEATRIICDNQSCIKLSENLVFHDRSKHIDIRCHFVRDSVQRATIQLRYTPTGEQVADILAKALGRTKFVHFREKKGMVKNPFQ
eukprot:PITA_32337